MTQSRRTNAVALALWVNAALLGAILVALLARRGGASALEAPAFAQDAAARPLTPPIAGGGGVFLMPGQLSQNLFGVWMMDIDKQTVWAYALRDSPPKLYLVAARSFANDRQLRNFSLAPPSPEEVGRMIEKEKDNARVLATQPAPAPAESPGP
jgi:hypothetical protein